MSNNILVSFSILGEPISKSNNLQFSGNRSYTPKKYKQYEDLIRLLAIEAWGDRPPLLGLIHIEISYYLKTRRKKDLLNLPKTTCDALNDVIYADDSQIVTSSLSKFYDKENPRVVITVSRPKTPISPGTEYCLPMSLEDKPVY